MFVVTEEQAATVRATYKQSGERSAAIELRQLFPGITDTALARECVRTIVGWRPLPKRLLPRDCDARKPPDGGPTAGGSTFMSCVAAGP